MRYRKVIPHSALFSSKHKKFSKQNFYLALIKNKVLFFKYKDGIILLMPCREEVGWSEPIHILLSRFCSE